MVIGAGLGWLLQVATLRRVDDTAAVRLVLLLVSGCGYCPPNLSNASCLTSLTPPPRSTLSLRLPFFVCSCKSATYLVPVVVYNILSIYVRHGVYILSDFFCRRTKALLNQTTRLPGRYVLLAAGETHHPSSWVSVDYVYCCCGRHLVFTRDHIPSG